MPDGQEWACSTRPFKVIDLIETRRSLFRDILEWEYHSFIVAGKRIIREIHDGSQSRVYPPPEIRRFVNGLGLRVVGMFSDREATKAPRKARVSDVSPVVVARRL